MTGGSTVVTFEINAGRRSKDRAFDVLNALRLIDISNNLGDAKSLMTHPATTTHRPMSPRVGPRRACTTEWCESRSAWRELRT